MLLVKAHQAQTVAAVQSGNVQGPASFEGVVVTAIGEEGFWIKMRVVENGVGCMYTPFQQMKILL